MVRGVVGEGKAMLSEGCRWNRGEGIGKGCFKKGRKQEEKRYREGKVSDVQKWGQRKLGTKRERRGICRYEKGEKGERGALLRECAGWGNGWVARWEREI